MREEPTIGEIKFQFQDSLKVINQLTKENADLRAKLERAEVDALQVRELNKAQASMVFDLNQRVQRAEAAGAEMREALISARTALHTSNSKAWHDANTLIGKFIKTGRDHRDENKIAFTCFQCGDGNTPLYCLNCAETTKTSDQINQIAGLIREKEAVIQERDDLLDRMRVARDHYDALLTRSEHSEAACAELRMTIELIGRFDWDEMGDRITHALSTQCGIGWLSPEKAGRLREALKEVVRTPHNAARWMDFVEQALAETI